MKFRPLVTTLAAGTLLLGNVAAFGEADPQLLEQQARDVQGTAAAGDHRRANETAPAHRNDERAQRTDNRSYHRDPRQDNRYDPRYYQRWDQSQSRYMPGDHFGGDWRGRGAGPEHDWYRGGYLPREYRGHNYVVDDWRAHHLYAPPAGYHWVQAPGGDYVLAAIATGLIASILLNQ